MFVKHSAVRFALGGAIIFWSAALLGATDLSANFKTGNPEIQSAGALAFGPEGILFAADPQAAAIIAVDTGDRQKGGATKPSVQGINEKIAALLGTTPDEILLNDMAVNPVSRNAYFSVSRGRGPGASPVLLKLGADGKLEEFPLKNVRYSKVILPNPPQAERQRAESITDLAYIGGRLFVAGLSNEEFASRLRSIPFPFKEADSGSSIEIYHGAHGQFETRSPVRTFAPYRIEDQDYLLAAYTCTPLVKLPVSDLKAGAHVKGITIAELGNRNRPLDMVVYQKGGKSFILMANSSRGVMKISAEGIDQVEAITRHVQGGGTAGLPYETIQDLKGVLQLDRLDAEHGVILVQTDSGSMNLQTITLP